MVRLFSLLLGAFAGVLLVSAAGAQAPAPLFPGVTFQHEVALTPHGPVAYSVITAPPPTGLYSIGPVLGGNAITGAREPVTQLEQDVAPTAVTAGINGDFFTGSDAHPTGIVMAGGQMAHGPTPAHTSIGFDTNGGIHVGRISFTGTWKGTGQRRPLAGVNQRLKANQVVLFTPAWGATTPEVANGAVALLEPFPASGINTDLTAAVTAIPDGSSATAIPSDGAVLVATGTAAAKLQDEAPVGTSVTVRLILPDSWGTVVSAVGGGPLLVKNGKAVFQTSENFPSSDLTSRQPRAGVGQLRDGRVILVAVDGGRPGYSVGMTTYEFAQTMAKLGAVTAAGLQYGKFVSVAFAGKLLGRPSDPSGERPVKEALLVQYAGVYAPPPSVAVVGNQNAAQGEQLAYSLVRPSTVTASVIAPDGTSHVLDSGLKQPGTYHFGWTSFDVEGTWHWKIDATDDLNRASTTDQAFLYDLTLSGLSVPRSTAAATGLRVGFTLSRPAAVTLQVETPQGAVIDVLPAAQLGAGGQTLAWDGATGAGAPTPPGKYVVRVTDASSIGTVAHTATFSLRH